MLSSACAFNPGYHKLTVSTDTYAIDEVSKIKIDSIFLDNTPTESDLSLLLISKSITLRLVSLDYTMATSEKSNYKLIYEFSLSEPISRINSSTSESKSSSTITKAGKDEEYTVESKVSYPTYSQYDEYRHKLKVKLYRSVDKKLMWQSESEIISEKNNSATYSELLVYTALQNFLQTSEKHPVRKKYTKKKQKIIAKSLR